MPPWNHIGLHRCYAEGNLFVMELGGAASLEEIRLLLNEQDQLIARYKTVLTLCDARQAQLPSPQIRKYLADRGKKLGDYKISSVVITDSLLIRTVVQLIERASRLLTGRPLDTAFVNTEEAAWRWINERRQRVTG